MYHSFAPYEQDFREWWASRTYPDVNPLTRDFLQHITRPAGGRLYAGGAGCLWRRRHPHRRAGSDVDRGVTGSETSEVSPTSEVGC